MILQQKDLKKKVYKKVVLSTENLYRENGRKEPTKIYAPHATWFCTKRFEKRFDYDAPTWYAYAKDLEKKVTEDLYPLHNLGTETMKTTEEESIEKLRERAELRKRNWRVK